MERSTKPADNNSQAPKVMYSGGEHIFLGNKLKLKGMDHLDLIEITGNNLIDGIKKFSLTYGEISALAGDFYGTYVPISNGQTLEDRRRLFLDAWKTLAENPEDQPADAVRLIRTLYKEMEAIDEGVRQGKDPSAVYGENPQLDDPYMYQALTSKLLSERKRQDLPSYMALATRNVDHFGDDAYKAYEAGHEVAMIQATKSKSDENLALAYAMNAFADHFLEDMFSSGHLRTPRRLLHGSSTVTPGKLEKDMKNRFSQIVAMTLYARDMGSKFMHDEECAIGLSVRNGDGDCWQCYGDTRLNDDINDKNRKICLETLQKSADEVYEAWKTGSAKPLPYAYKKYIPIPEVQTLLQPLFVNKDGSLAMRWEWGKRTSSDTVVPTSEAWLQSHIVGMFTGERFKYPIKITN